MSDPIATEYTTTDYGLAAALKAAGAEMTGVKLEPSSSDYPRGRAIFCFVDGDPVQGMVQSFYADTLQVPARRFLSELKDFRGAVFDKDRFGRGNRGG
jgi:hypothetical protein